MEKTITYNELQQEIIDLRSQLEEANDTIEAIRSGEVDALIVKQKDGLQLFTLKSADQSYRIFIEQMTEGAVTLSEDNIILYCNSQFATLVQLPLEKVTGQSFLQFVSADCISDFEACIDLAWKESAKGEMTLSASNGSRVPVLMSFKTLHLDEGLSMSIIITNLTKQKANQQLLEQKNQQLEEAKQITQQLNAGLENKVRERTSELETALLEKTNISEALRNNQDRLSLVLETMAEGVCIMNIDEKITYANPMAQVILGVEKNVILTRNYNDEKWINYKLDGTLLPKEEHPMSVMMKSGIPVYDYEVGLQPPGRERFYISINAAPIRDSSGTLIGGVFTFMDVTNRRKAIQQKDEFISVASHELKTPMTTLKASLQILAQLMSEDRSSPMLPVFLNKANVNLVKLSGLVDDLLNVSRLEKGQLILKKAWFNVYDMVKENADNLKFINNGIEPVIISGAKDISILADRYRIEQVLTNLLNNAVKYSAVLSTIKINIELWQNDSVKISVKDSGIGIPADKQQQLFDRYFRVDYSGNQYSGLGLGLYISNEIIVKHNGKIGVESELGKGSTFWFTLPVK